MAHDFADADAEAAALMKQIAQLQAELAARTPRAPPRLTVAAGSTEPLAAAGSSHISTDELCFRWGRGNAACGLDAFDGGHRLTGSAADAARTWQRLLFEGDAGKLPLTGLSPTFVCQSRREALEILAPRLTQLDNGTLSGQGNCFAVLGARGVGKTHFMQTIAHVVEHVGRPTTCVIHVNMKSIGLREPLKLLQDALLDPRSGVALPAHLRGPDVMMSSLLDFMRDSGRRALLLLDGIESLYTSDEESHERAWRQLYSIGEYDDTRPVMVMLTGSTAALRALLYAVPGYGGTDAVTATCKAYGRFLSLNDRKYVPLTLHPIVAADDVRRAILCISSGIPAACVEALLHDELLEAPSGAAADDENEADDEGEADDEDEAAADAEDEPAAGFSSTGVVSARGEEAAGGAGAHLGSAARPAPGAAADGAGCAGSSDLSGVNLLAAGYRVSDDFVEWVCARCRGLARWIAETLRDRRCRTKRLYHVEQLLGELRQRKPMLRRLLRAWLRNSTDPVFAAAEIYDDRACDYGMPLAADEPVAPWLRLMDASVVDVHGSSAGGFTVHFLHPSDAGTLLLQFPEEA